jgi:hypothetical protein
VDGNASHRFQVTYVSEEEIKDNYPMILYGDQIQQQVESILDVSDAVVTNLKFDYIQQTEAYTDYESYRNNQNVSVIFDLNINADDYREGAKNAYALLSKLEDAGYYFNCRVTVLDKTVIAIYSDYVPMISNDDWVKRFTE